MKPIPIKFMESSKLIASQKIFDGAIVELYLNQLHLNGMTVERELINHYPAVAVLAITPEDKVVLVRQYRAAIDRELLEIPAGIIDLVSDGELEDPLVACKRELEEETDYAATTWESLGDVYVSPGFLNEQIYLFQATGLTRVANPLPADDDEDILIVELTKQEVRELMNANEIQDAKTRIALMHWLATN